MNKAMRWWVTGLVGLGCLMATAAAEEFDSWAPHPDAEKQVCARLGQDGPAAKAYLDQIFGLMPNLDGPTLRRCQRARQQWQRDSQRLRAPLAEMLDDSNAYVRYLAAVLLEHAQDRDLLRRRLAKETHRDVRHALEAALAEAGDDTVARVRRLVQAEREEKEANRPYQRVREIRCIHLIDLVCHVHRPEAVRYSRGMSGDDGGLGETWAGDDLYLRADLGYLTGRERKQLGLGPSPLRVVTVRRSPEEGADSFPRLQGHVDPKLQAHVNELLREAFLAPKRPPGYREVRKFQVTRLDDEFLSVRFEASGIAAGTGSHRREFRGMTIDLRVGQELSLSDLFRPGSPWEKAVRERVVESVKGRFQASEIQNLKNYYLTREKLVLQDILGDGSGIEAPLDPGFLHSLAEPGLPLHR